MPGLFDDDQSLDIAQESLQNLLKDRNTFKDEVSEQVRQHIMKHLTAGKVKPSDLVKPRVSEGKAYDMQKYSMANRIANLEDKVTAMDAAEQEGEEFDKQAYSKLKEELRKRKQAKETLLSGNMPQFKAYLRF